MFLIEAHGDTRERRRLALLIVLVTWAACALTCRKEIFLTHTAQNHFALLAEGWLAGRLDLGGPPPDYAGNNDFAIYAGRHWISFPPFPAVLIAPLVWLSGGAAHVRDGLFFMALAPLAPVILFGAMLRLRDAGLTKHSARSSAMLALVLPLGTVFWFSSVQGTVWFAAHVVGTALAAIYAWASVEARHPIVAGFALALGFATRTPLLFAVPFFVAEAVRVSGPRTDPIAHLLAAARRVGTFLAPVMLVGVLLMIYNNARFGNPFEFGHRHLDVVWRTRIEKWGLFSVHYVGKNLGVMFGGLPFFGHGRTPIGVGPHGLALWVTSPFLAWLLFPRIQSKRVRRVFFALLTTVVCVALPSVLYHNTGWVQFGYRFSNDWMVFAILMLALARPKLGIGLWIAVGFAVLVNVFGAVTFGDPNYAHRYPRTPHNTYFEPD